MKIFNVENGKKVLYVQISDIINLFKLEDNIPDFIRDKYNNISKNNFTIFYKITNENDILYFDSLEWILDYNSFEKLDKNQIDEYKDVIKNLYKNKFDEYTLKRIKNESSIQDKIFLDKTYYMLEEIEDMISLKEGFSTKSVPKVESTVKDPIIIDGCPDYVLNYGLTNNTIIIKRKDNGIIDYDDLDVDLLIDIIEENLANFYFDFYHEEIKMSDKVIINLNVKLNHSNINMDDKYSIKNKVKSLFKGIK